MNKCPRCGYATDDMSNFRKHLKTKTVCAPLVSNDDLSTLLKRLFPLKSKPFKCSKCHKCFSSQKGHVLHESVCMKQVLTDTSLDQGKVIPYSQNLGHRNVFGYEDTSYINESTLYDLSQESVDGALKLIDLIFFNDEHPENRNVWMRTLTDVYVYRSNGWQLENIMIVTKAMCSTAIVMLKNSVFKRYDPLHSNLEDMAFSILYLRPHKYASIRQGIQTKLVQQKHGNKP